VFVADPSKPKLFAQLQVNLRLKMLEQQKEGIKNTTQTVDGRRSKKFVAKCNKARKVLELMGCPTLIAEGEAEQLCAQLNRAGLVDGCVSQDGDCLCFGARRVFKTFSACQQATGWPLEYFDSDDISARLGLGREQLVAAMLLLGCDFCDGVEHTGTAKARRFLREHGADVLARLRAWARGQPAAGIHLYEDPHRDGRRQPPHCSRCGRPDCEDRGRRAKECAPRAAGFVCECAWCEHVRNWDSQRFLRTMIDRLGRLDPGLTDAVVRLFLHDAPAPDTARWAAQLQWRRPDLAGLQALLRDTLRWDAAHAERVLLPLLTARFFDDPADADYTPIAVVAAASAGGRRVYRVAWRRRDAGPAPAGREGGPRSGLVTTLEGADFVEAAAPFQDLLARFRDPARRAEQLRALDAAALPDEEGAGPAGSFRGAAAGGPAAAAAAAAAAKGGGPQDRLREMVRRCPPRPPRAHSGKG
jgi:hypothetical protein